MRKSAKQAIAEALWLDIDDPQEYQPGHTGKTRVYTVGNDYYIAVKINAKGLAPIPRVTGFEDILWSPKGKAIRETHQVYEHKPSLGGR